MVRGVTMHLCPLSLLCWEGQSSQSCHSPRLSQTTLAGQAAAGRGEMPQQRGALPGAVCHQLMETAAAPGQGQEQGKEQRDSPRGTAEIQKVFIVRVIYKVSLRNSGGKG